MIYLLDGYNLIFSLSDSHKNLKVQRDETILFLKKRFAIKKISGILVFDGSHLRDEESGLSYPSPLIVAYAPKNMSADDYIIEKVEFSKNPKVCVVVTNDKGLARHVKSMGAKVESNADFIAWISKNKTKKASREAKDSPQNIERLLKIFEKRLEEDLED